MQDLLAAIYANPERDDLRLVYADQLMEGGEPRGEFISLQMLPRPTRAQGKRMTTLLRQHRDRWLGALRPAVVTRGLIFERGFLARAVMPRSPRGARGCVGDAAWGTVTHLDASSGWCFDAAGFVHPAMRSLHTLHGAPLQVAIDILDNATPLPLRALGIDRIGVFDREPLDAREVRRVFQRPRGAPELRHLIVGEVVAAEGLSWLLESPLGGRLETLRLTEPSSAYWSGLPLRTPVFSGRGIRWLLEQPSRPAVVVLETAWTYTILGQSLHVTVASTGAHPSYEQLSEVIRGLHGAPLDSLVVSVYLASAPSAAERDQLASAVEAALPSVPARLPAVSDR